MFNIGFTELVILCLIGLLVIGPEQLPDMARKLARLLNELKRAKDEIMKPMDDFKQQAWTAMETARKTVDEQLNRSASELLKPDAPKTPAAATTPTTTAATTHEAAPSATPSEDKKPNT